MDMMTNPLVRSPYGGNGGGEEIDDLSLLAGGGNGNGGGGGMSPPTPQPLSRQPAAAYPTAVGGSPLTPSTLPPATTTPLSRQQQQPVDDLSLLAGPATPATGAPTPTTPTTTGAVPPPPDRGVLGETYAAVAGGAFEGLRSGVQAIRAVTESPYAAEPSYLSGISRRMEEYQKESPTLQESPNLGTVGKAVFGGLRSFTQSAMFGLPAVAAASGLVASGGTLGALAGTLAFATGAGATFTLSQFRETLDKGVDNYMRQGVSRKEAVDKTLPEAVVQGAAEGGFEFLSDFLMGKFMTGGLLSRPAKDAVKASIRDLTKVSFKELAGRFGKTAAAEVGTEMLTGGIQAQSDTRLGIGNETFWSGAKEAIGPSFVASMLFGGLGHVNRKAAQGRLVQHLENTDANLKDRTRAAFDVYNTMRGYDENTAKIWLENAKEAIIRGEAITTNEDILNLQERKAQLSSLELKSAFEEKYAQRVDDALKGAKERLGAAREQRDAAEEAWAKYQPTMEAQRQAIVDRVEAAKGGEDFAKVKKAAKKELAALDKEANGLRKAAEDGRKAQAAVEREIAISHDKLYNMWRPPTMGEEYQAAGGEGVPTGPTVEVRPAGSPLARASRMAADLAKRGSEAQRKRVAERDLTFEQRRQAEAAAKERLAREEEVNNLFAAFDAEHRAAMGEAAGAVEAEEGFALDENKRQVVEGMQPPQPEPTPLTTPPLAEAPPTAEPGAIPTAPATIATPPPAQQLFNRQAQMMGQQAQQEAIARRASNIPAVKYSLVEGTPPVEGTTPTGTAAATTAPAPIDPGIRDAILATVVRLSDRVAAGLRVAPTFSALPQALQDQAIADHGPNAADIVRGVQDPATGQHWVIADRLESPYAAQHTLLHEVGHAVKRGVHGSDAGAVFFRGLYAAKSNLMGGYAANYKADTTTPEGKALVAEEWWMDMMAQGRYGGGKFASAWAKYVKMFNNALRTMGFDITVSERELAGWAKAYRDGMFGDTAWAVAAPAGGDMSPRYMLAHHGSPYKWIKEGGWPYGRPRLDKIGTGEGAAAYGWGWYSAEERRTASSYVPGKGSIYTYQSPLLIGDTAFNSPTQLYTARNEAFQSGNRVDGIMYDILQRAMGNGYKSAQAITKAMKERPGLWKDWGWQQRDVDAAMKKIRKEVHFHRPTLYTLDIPDDVVPRLLDWDKPLSEQSEYVKTALKKHLAENTLIDAQFSGDKIVASNGGLLNGDPSGERIYNLWAHNWGEKAASEHLASIGIPGNKYLDQMSRGKGEGTYNYVIWDQGVLDRVVPLAVNGVPTGLQPQGVAATEAAGTPATGDQRYSLAARATNTTTEEFKAWSGGHPVIKDTTKHTFKTGEPVVPRAYHGSTERRLTTIDPGAAIETSGVAFFSDNPDVSEIFRYPREYGEVLTQEYDEDADEYVDVEPGALEEVYLRLTNPLVLTGKEAQKATDDTIYQVEVVKKAKSAGHDGIILVDVEEGVGDWVERGTTFGIFSKFQVKSTENSGAWSRTDPAIRYSLLGPTATNWGGLLGRFSSLYDRKEKAWIDDSQSSLTSGWDTLPTTPIGADVRTVATNTVPLSSVFDHPALYAAYPELADMQVRRQEMRDPGAVAHYDDDRNLVLLSANVTDPAEIRRIIMHEAAHWVQRKEGWGRGGSPMMDLVLDNYDKVLRAAEKAPRADELVPQMEKLGTVLSSFNSMRDEIRLAKEAYRLRETEVTQLRDAVESQLTTLRSSPSPTNAATINKLESLRREYTAELYDTTGATDLGSRQQRLDEAKEAYAAARQPYAGVEFLAYQLLSGEVEARFVADMLNEQEKWGKFNTSLGTLRQEVRALDAAKHTVDVATTAAFAKGWDGVTATPPVADARARYKEAYTALNSRLRTLGVEDGLPIDTPSQRTLLDTILNGSDRQVAVALDIHNPATIGMYTIEDIPPDMAITRFEVEKEVADAGGMTAAIEDGVVDLQRLGEGTGVRYSLAPPTTSNANPLTTAATAARNYRDEVTDFLVPIRGAWSDIVSRLLRATVPGAASPQHLQAAETFSTHVGVKNHLQEVMGHRLQAANDYFTRNPKEMWQWASAVMTGKPLTGKLKEYADLVNTMLEEARGYLDDAGVPLETVRPHYFPGVWTNESIRAFNQALQEEVEAGTINPATFDVNTADDATKKRVSSRVAALLKARQGMDGDQAMAAFAKRPLSGSESFRRGKVFDDVLVAREFGLVPKSEHVIDIVKMKLDEMYRSAMGANAVREFSDKKEIVPTGLDGRPLDPTTLRPLPDAAQLSPDEWDRVNDRFGTIYYRNNRGELVKRGYYMARRPTADILNNYLSTPIYSNPTFGRLFRIYRAIADALNQFQLGVGSMFHAGFTTGETTVSGLANNIKDVYKWRNGEIDAAEVMRGVTHTLTSPYSNPKQGGEYLKAYLEGGGSDFAMDVVRAVELVGAKTQLDFDLRTQQLEEMKRDWYSDKKLKAIMRSPIAFTEYIARPIMTHLVPRQKLGVFGELVRRIQRDNPGVALENLVPELRKAWNRVDSRLGQVVYDRIYAHNVAKNAVQAMMRAPGWTFGTIAEVGGSVKDTKDFFKEWAKTGKAPANIPDRVAYTVSLVVVSAAINAALTYMFTGEPPEGMDYWSFRTGDKDEYGRAERFMLPTYAKDLVAYWRHPTSTLSHKIHPLLSVINEAIIQNKDYYGVEVRNPGDNPIKQLADVVKFGIKQFVPFWMRGVGKEVEREGGEGIGGAFNLLTTRPAKTVAPLVGIMPAPAEYNKSAAERLMTQIGAEERASGAITQKEREHFDLKRRIRHDYMVGKEREAEARMQGAIQQGLLSKREINQLRKTRGETPTSYVFKRLAAEDALRVWNVMTPDERKAASGELMVKMRSVLKNSSPAKRAELLPQFKEALAGNR